VILLAEHDEPILAAKKKRQHGASSWATSTPKNRVWGFENSPSGRPVVEPQLTQENATGSVQYTYQIASGRAEWLSRDPIAERGGINLYDYVLNNPVKHTDKLGLVIGVDDAAEAALVIEGATIFWNAEGPEIEEDLAPLSEEAEIELNQLEELAKQLYPKLANTCQMHHPLPQYLGGAADQDLVPLDGAYHQLITNAFRQQIPYGSTFTPAQVQAAWNQVYSQYPITR
jgi:RHS repeat-associated protein